MPRAVVFALGVAVAEAVAAEDPYSVIKRSWMLVGSDRNQDGVSEWENSDLTWEARAAELVKPSSNTEAGRSVWRICRREIRLTEGVAVCLFSFS